MRDLTQGSIPRHIIRMAAPMAIGMLFQTAYFFVDLYFVGRLGDAAIAGVGTAGNLQFMVMAVSQVLSVGTMVIISHAAGRKDGTAGTLTYNQSLVLSAIAGVLTLLLGYTAGFAWVCGIAADARTAELGIDYLAWFLPALALQFPLGAMMSTLRATGIAQPTMVIQVATVVLNAILAPVLIAGWGTGRP
ncbi:MAG: MATE family efflux transporter, partial [Gemmatimonadota bacterium]